MPEKRMPRAVLEGNAVAYAMLIMRGWDTKEMNARILAEHRPWFVLRKGGRTHHMTTDGLTTLCHRPCTNGVPFGAGLSDDYPKCRACLLVYYGHYAPVAPASAP